MAVAERRERASDDLFGFLRIRHDQLLSAVRALGVAFDKPVLVSSERGDAPPVVIMDAHQYSMMLHALDVADEADHGVGAVVLAEEFLALSEEFALR